MADGKTVVLADEAGFLAFDEVDLPIVDVVEYDGFDGNLNEFEWI